MTHTEEEVDEDQVVTATEMVVVEAIVTPTESVVVMEAM